MPKIMINPDDLPDLGPMPAELQDRLVDRLNSIIRNRPEFLDRLRVLAGAEENDETAAGS